MRTVLEEKVWTKESNWRMKNLETCMRPASRMFLGRGRGESLENICFAIVKTALFAK